jgi:hypothetical protein
MGNLNDRPHHRGRDTLCQYELFQIKITNHPFSCRCRFGRRANATLHSG